MFRIYFTPRFYGLSLFYLIIQNQWHLPFIEGKPNISRIEDMLTIESLRNNIYPVSKEDYEYAINMIECLGEDGLDEDSDGFRYFE